jgi:hypothetical protein
MTHFKLIAQQIPVQSLLNELDANPDIWDERPERRFGESPHRESSDIWVRYADPHWLARTGDFAGSGGVESGRGPGSVVLSSTGLSPAS